MSVLVPFNGTAYLIPSPGETGWGATLTAFLADLGNNAAVNGSAIDNTPIGSTTPNTGAFTSLSVGGLPLALGTEIGDTLGPLVSSSTNFPMLATTNRLTFQRADPTSADVSDFQFDRTTTFTGGTPLVINRVIGVHTVLGTGDGTQTASIRAIGSTASSIGGMLPNVTVQTTRTAGSNAWIWGALVTTNDATGLSTSAGNIPNQDGVEINTLANQADDITSLTTYGGFGVRKGIRVTAGRSNANDITQTEVSSGIWFSTAGSQTLIGAADPYTNFQQAIGFAVGTQIRSGLDTRGAVAPAGSLNPVSAVIMSPGHNIDFAGGTNLTSPSSRTLHYSAGSSLLKYDVNGVSQFSIGDTGAITLSPLTNAVNDAAAATAGVEVNSLYRNGSVVMIRVI